MNSVLPTQGLTPRKVVYRTRGSSHGPIARLMSPSDLGERLKPFVFLDLFEADLNALSGSMPLHPHSGIATVTVFTSGDATFDDPQAGHGTLGYGGVEFVRTGSGVWHGKELSAALRPQSKGSSCGSRFRRSSRTLRRTRSTSSRRQASALLV